jgi:hypothetical protein
MISLSLLFSACDGDRSSSGDSSSDTGSISFKLIWQNPAIQRNIQSAKSPSGDVCEDYLIERVAARVYDSSGTEVARDSWPCDTPGHTGTIKNVKTGSGMYLIADGEVAGNVYWQGQSETFTVSPGQTTSAGTITMTYIAGFTAYIDLNSQEGDSNRSNVLKIVPKYVYPEDPIDPPIDPEDRLLKDFDTGNYLDVTIQVDMDVRYPTNNGADSADGTDAHQIFGGKVDGAGNYELDADDSVTLTFNNLDPEKQYVVAVTYNRDGGINFSDRVTKFTIEGADDYLQDSSLGVVVNNDDSVSFSTGNNTANGYVARWTGVTAEDGSFSIKAEQDRSKPEWEGEKAYAMTSVMLQEEP